MAISVQLYDDPSADRPTARFISFGEPNFHAAQFTVIECQKSRRIFFAIITGPNLNLNRNSLSPTDNTAINQLEQVSLGALERSVAVNEVFYYEAQILKEIVYGRGESVRVRPQIGANMRAATEDEIVSLLKLPEVKSSLQIGSIIDTQVPICVSTRQLLSHTLIAGTTGSGKTNTMANIFSAAVRSLGISAILFDHKPDYQHTNLRNDDGDEPHYKGMEDVEFWYIGGSYPLDNRSENEISVPARLLDPEMLISTIFNRDGEQIMAEVCGIILFEFIEKNPSWGMHDFRQYLASHEAKEVPGKPKSETYSAIQRRLMARGRVPSWIDSGRPSLLHNQLPFNPAELIKPGKMSVIRIASSAGGGREYGLLLSYILDQINQKAENPRLPCPALIGVDEAQDIFCASKQLTDVAIPMLDRHIRKGRSKHIGFVVGVQSAMDVPDSILNNLNSRILHRHNSPELIRVAGSMATEDQRRMTNSFGEGEALVFLNGSNSIIHAQMRRSPFRLSKEELS